MGGPPVGPSMHQRISAGQPQNGQKLPESETQSSQCRGGDLPRGGQRHTSGGGISGMNREIWWGEPHPPILTLGLHLTVGAWGCRGRRATEYRALAMQWYAYGIAIITCSGSMCTGAYWVCNGQYGMHSDCILYESRYEYGRYYVVCCYCCGMWQECCRYLVCIWLRAGRRRRKVQQGKGWERLLPWRLPQNNLLLRFGLEPEFSVGMGVPRGHQPVKKKNTPGENYIYTKKIMQHGACFRWSFRKSKKNTKSAEKCKQCKKLYKKMKIFKGMILGAV